MDVTFFIPLIVSWISHTFPSLSQYAEYIGPTLMGVVTFIGIFTNLLPEPEHKYPVPDVTDLEVQLQGGGGLILKIAKFTRTLTISLNWFIATAAYGFFYNTANSIAKFIPKFKKKETGTLQTK